MIADKLQQLQTIKDNIKTAINNKGGNVGDDFTTYATAIDNIEGGGGGTGDCTLESITITENGTYEGAYDKVTVLIDDRYEDGVEDGISNQKSKLSSISITKNGTYTNENGYNSINVNVEGGGSITKIDVTDYNFRESTFKTLPNIFDFSKKTWFENTFYDCSELQSINIDTSSAFLFRGTFNYCKKLETINELNCENVELFTSLFINCESLTNIGGFKDLGKTNQTVYLNLSASDLITRESMLNVFNSIYDCSNMGYNPREITISSVVRNRLTESDIAIATNKNWTVKVV